MRSKPVALLTMRPRSFVKASSARTSKRGTVSLGFRPARENYVRLKLRRYSYGNQATYYVTRQGKVSLAGR